MSLMLPTKYLMCFTVPLPIPNPDMAGTAVALSSESGPTAATYSLHPNKCLGRSIGVVVNLCLRGFPRSRLG